MATKIGFNNFKSFGSKMQYFSKKPITLIYGPNSVGKSSLIRAILYKEYLKRPYLFDYKIMIDKKLQQLINIDTHQFGDSLDIGTFKSIIHKNDISKSINYDIEHTLIYEVIDFIALNSYSSFMLLNIVMEIKNLGYKLEDIFDTFTIILENNKSDLNELESKLYNEIIPIFKNILNLSNEQLFDVTNQKRLTQFFIYLLTQFSIERVRITTQVSMNDEMEHYNLEHEIYINDILLLSCTEKNKSHIRIELYANNEIFRKIFFVPNELELKDKYIFDEIDITYEFLHSMPNILNCSNSFEESLEYYIKIILLRIIKPSKYSKDNYYIGPIRNIPSRKDLFGSKNFFKKQRRKQRKIEKKSKECILLNVKSFAFLYNSKYFSFIYWLLFAPLFMFCSSCRLISTFYNSLFVSRKSFIKYIKPNIKTNFFLWHTLIENKRIRNKVNEWLKDKGKHNSSYTLNLGDDTELTFYDQSMQTNVHPQDMGVGISQSLPIIIASNLFQDRNIYVEQPELHLHPKLQMELADEFIKSMHENENNFILETHSEHLLLRLMKRIRHTNEGILEDESLKLTPDDVCLLYVDNDGEQTYIQELRLSKTGKLLDHWPNGFFEEGYKERFF